MKALLALALFSTLGASQAFAAHACIISSAYDAVSINHKNYSQIYIACDGANKETRTITLKNPYEQVSNANIATVIADLAGKGYKLATETSDHWIMVNEAP